MAVQGTLAAFRPFLVSRLYKKLLAEFRADFPGRISGRFSRISGPKGRPSKLKPGTVRKQPKEVWVQEVARQAPGGCLVSIVCIFP